jgi:hypothetical protein
MGSAGSQDRWDDPVSPRLAGLHQRLTELRAGSPATGAGLEHARGAARDARARAAYAHRGAAAAHRQAALLHRRAATRADDLGDASSAELHRAKAVEHDEAAVRNLSAAEADEA